MEFVLHFHAAHSESKDTWSTRFVAGNYQRGQLTEYRKREKLGFL